MFIYSFCFSRTRAILQLQSSKPNAWFFLPCGPRQLQYKSISVLKRHSTTATTSTLLRRKRAATGGGVLTAEAASIGFCRLRLASVGGDPVPSSSSSRCGLEQTRIGPFIGGHRWPSIIIIFYQVKCTGRIEGQGQVYLLAIEGTIVHWRSL